MIELCPAGRAGTPDEVGTLGALLMGPDGAFITGSDFLIDGGVTASYFYGDLQPTSTQHPDRERHGQDDRRARRSGRGRLHPSRVQAAVDFGDVEAEEATHLSKGILRSLTRRRT